MTRIPTLMKRVRSAFLLLLGASACTPTPKAGPADDRAARELAIVMAVGVQETTQLKTGQWALYSVRTAGSTATMATRLAVVGGDAGQFWIENKTITPAPGGG